MYLDIILSKSKPGQANRLLKPGGLILADNVLRRAIVADATPTNPHFAESTKRHGEEQTLAMVQKVHEYNDKAVDNPRLETFLMPLFDGLGMTRLLD